jgi:hypothetical protein
LSPPPCNCAGGPFGVSDGAALCAKAALLISASAAIAKTGLWNIGIASEKAPRRPHDNAELRAVPASMKILKVWNAARLCSACVHLKTGVMDASLAKAAHNR